MDICGNHLRGDIHILGMFTRRAAGAYLLLENDESLFIRIDVLVVMIGYGMFQCRRRIDVGDFLITCASTGFFM